MSEAAASAMRRSHLSVWCWCLIFIHTCIHTYLILLLFWEEHLTGDPPLDRFLVCSIIDSRCNIVQQICRTYLMCPGHTVIIMSPWWSGSSAVNRPTLCLLYCTCPVRCLSGETPLFPFCCTECQPVSRYCALCPTWCSSQLIVAFKVFVYIHSLV